MPPDTAAAISGPDDLPLQRGATAPVNVEQRNRLAAVLNGGGATSPYDYTQLPRFTDASGSAGALMPTAQPGGSAATAAAAGGRSQPQIQELRDNPALKARLLAMVKGEGR
jgi:hypothetical protein